MCTRCAPDLGSDRRSAVIRQPADRAFVLMRCHGADDTSPDNRAPTATPASTADGPTSDDHAQCSTSEVDILSAMSKTSVEVDQDIVREAAAILGTRTLRDTIDAALREVVHAKRRIELVALLSQEGRFDFDAAEGAWGADG